jgi:ubiquinone/menaquinone biosynthesis C-methylase UbiE
MTSYNDSINVTGLDFSGKAISFCRRNYNHDRLNFIPGDAENLPFGDSSFDIIVNVESSHCYNSMEKFLSQVKRVLSHGGYLLITDFRDSEHVARFVDDIHKSGMKIIASNDITQNVFSAIRQHNQSRMDMISRKVPRLLLGLFKEFAGVEGSTIHRKFTEEKTQYLSFVLQKELA